MPKALNMVHVGAALDTERLETRNQADLPCASLLWLRDISDTWFIPLDWRVRNLHEETDIRIPCQ